MHPDWARRGLGRMLLDHCENEAARQGFRGAQLMATLPGYRLYRACGYLGDERVRHTLEGGIGIDFIPMQKALQPCTA